MKEYWADGYGVKHYYPEVAPPLGTDKCNLAKETVESVYLVRLEAIADTAGKVRGNAVIDVAWGDKYRLVRIPIANWQALGDALDALGRKGY